MKKTIVLFTDSFPYATKETFLNTEILFLSKYFTNVYIIPLRSTAKKRAVPDNVSVIDQFANTRENTIFRIIKTLFTKLFYKSIFLDFPKSVSLNYIKLSFIWSFNADKMKKIVDAFIKKENIDLDNTIFYTYTFTSNTIALSTLKDIHNNMKIITRVHGGDLYENVHNISLFPLRSHTLLSIDKVYSISQYGISHLQQIYPKYIEKFALSKLGVLSYGKSKKRADANSIHIVSCSNIIALKRVHLIAEIISRIEHIDVIWTHFGQGNDAKLDNVLSKLPETVRVTFMGQQPNENIYKFYVNNCIDIFINVSISEGIPVSIMEAMSAAIPVIATNVGGVSEIVTNNYNGFLLEKEFKINDAIQKIYHIINNKDRFGTNAYLTWNENYNAENNYKQFCQSI